MKLYNYFIAVILFSISVLPLTAETDSEAFTNRVNREILSHWTPEQISNYYKQYQSRIPNIRKLPAPVPASEELINLYRNAKVDNLQAAEVLTSVPADLVVPGEFEELKAVIVTWPYFHLDSLGNEVDFNFDGGVGVKIDYRNQTYSIVKCYSYPDVKANSTMAPVFLNMINGIQKYAEVWLTVANLADSAEILNYAAGKGITLSNVKYIAHDNNAFWYRDCGPVAFYYNNYNKTGFIDFEYYPGRPLDDEVSTAVGEAMNIPILKSTIEYEGGNIICDGLGSLFTSDMLSVNNTDTYGQYFISANGQLSYYDKNVLTLAQCKDSISKVMNLTKMHVLPTFVNDGGTGHVDLYADMFDENEFVFSHFPTQMSSQADYSTEMKNIDSILSWTSGMDAKYTAAYLPFPRKDNGNWYEDEDDYESYTRTYSNHLVVNKAIIQPIFYNANSGDKDYELASIDSIKAAYPGYEIVPVDMRAFDGYGGSIHCITKQVPADNPIRIFHRPLTMTDYYSASNSFPVATFVLSNQIITSVTLYYKMKDETNWTSVEMNNTSESLWSCSLPAIINEGEEKEIDYYISATAGSISKTITKPMTAPAGYYTINTKTSGVAETTNVNAIATWPNPANEEIFAKFELANAGNYEVKLINETGSTVYSGNISGNGPGSQLINLKTSNFATGSYLLVITPQNGQNQTTSFVISR